MNMSMGINPMVSNRMKPNWTYEEQLTNEAIIDQVKVLDLITIELTSQIFFAAQEQRVVLYRDFEKYRCIYMDY